MQTYIASGNSTEGLKTTKPHQCSLESTIEHVKNEYYSKLSIKLLKLKTSSCILKKSILKRFLNNKKISFIPSKIQDTTIINVLLILDKLLFNSFFAQQCSVITVAHFRLMYFSNRPISNIQHNFSGWYFGKNSNPKLKQECYHIIPVA